MPKRILGYCVGKASRYQLGQNVEQVPYISPHALDIYDLLRSAIFTTRDHAERACLLLSRVNPVGFVVLVLVEKEQV